MQLRARPRRQPASRLTHIRWIRCRQRRSALPATSCLRRARYPVTCASRRSACTSPKRTLYAGSAPASQSRRGQPVERLAWVVVHDRSSNDLYDGIVALARQEIVRWTYRPGLQGSLRLTEYDEVAELVKRDPRWREAILRRGIDIAHVRIDAWMIGNFGIAAHEGRRLFASLAYVRERPPDLPYARPIEGVVAYVDLDELKVVEVLDPEPVPVPADPGRYDPGVVGAMREDLKPIEITQPDGPSFRVHGHEIAWQRWRLRWSFNAREGLVLHTVGFEDDGEVRPIAHRLSLSEIVVPYGDPSPAPYWQGPFDAGAFGL